MTEVPPAQTVRGWGPTETCKVIKGQPLTFPVGSIGQQGAMESGAHAAQGAAFIVWCH